MSIDRLTSLTPPVTGVTSPGQDRSDLERLKTKDLAHEFESMMLLQMLRQMRQSMFEEKEDGESDGLSSSTMLDTVDSELARALSRSGGFGIADVLMKAFDRKAEADAASGVSHEAGAVDGLERVPAAAWSRGAALAEQTLEPGTDEASKVSSAYGWRSDPFTGMSKFHGGIDLRAAYGQTVPAAADGRVVSAGEQGAYGLSIVIEHSTGLQTRYAHLSAIDVAVGDSIQQGQEIGRVGQTGRATGPHLHFEVIQDGRRVDPSRVMALNGNGLGGLKLTGGDADFPLGRRTVPAATSGADDENRGQ
jgi:murein DD-endopeptidase MepM/ murein hydrolase activator NlpD